jgi:hypothetical protein
MNGWEWRRSALATDRSAAPPPPLVHAVRPALLGVKAAGPAGQSVVTGAREHRPGQVRPGHVDVPQVAASQVGGEQCRAPQVRSPEIRALRER